MLNKNSTVEDLLNKPSSLKKENQMRAHNAQKESDVSSAGTFISIASEYEILAAKIEKFLENS